MKSNSGRLQLWKPEILIFLSITGLCCLAQNNGIIDRVLVPRFLVLNIGLFALLIILILKSGPVSVNLDPVIVCGTVYCFLYIASVSWATVTSEAFFHAGKVFSGVLFFFLSSVLLRSQNQLTGYSSVLTGLLVLIYSFFGINQILMLDEINGITVYSISSLSAHRNLFSSFLFLCVPFLLNGAIDYKRLRAVFLSGVLLCIFFIIILQTRAVWVGCFVTISLYGVLLVARGGFRQFNFQKRHYAIFISVFLVFLLLIGYIFIHYNFLDEFLASLDITSKTRAQSVAERFQQWDNTLKIFLEHPLLGIGAGNWAFFYPQFSLSGNQEALEGITFQRPHNDFLWVLSESGLLGLVAYVTLFLIPVIKSIAMYLKDPFSVLKSRHMLTACFLTGFLSISFFDFPRERIEHMILSYLLLAMLYTQVEIRPARSVVIRKGFMALLFMPLVLANIYIASERIKGERNTIKLYRAKENKDWEGVLRYAVKASGIFYDTDPTSMPLAWYKGLAYSHQKNYQQSLKEFEKSFKMAPFNYYVLNNLGIGYSRLDKRDTAKRCFNESLRINPEYDEARLNLAIIYYADKEYAKALTLVKLSKISERREKYLRILVPLVKDLKKKQPN